MKKSWKNKPQQTKISEKQGFFLLFLIVCLDNFTRNNMALEKVPTGYKFKHVNDACPGIFAQICIFLSFMIVCQKIKKVILLKKKVDLWTAKFLLYAEILSSLKNPTETNVCEVIESWNC